MEETNQTPTFIDNTHINKNSPNEKADVYNVINTLRELTQKITSEQAATFLSNLSKDDNIGLFLSDVGPFLHNFDFEGMMEMMNSCKYNKGKRAVVVNLADCLPDGTTDENKGAVCELIGSTFERNKAKAALGI